MTYQVGQLTYSLYPAIAAVGQLADNNTVNRIVSKVAGGTIHPGRALELASDGSVQEMQQTSSTLAVYGFSVLLTAKEGVGNNNDTANAVGSSFLAGEMVPVLRKGSMFAEWKGTTQVEGATPNIYHSSDSATGAAADRGKVTDAATGVVTGAENTLAPHWIQLRAALPGSGSLALIEVNAPGAV